MTRPAALTRPLVLALLVSALGLVSPGPALACDCLEPPPPEEALEDAEAVFAGEVVELVEVGEGPPGPWHHARVEVDEVWKGAVHEAEVVRTHAHGATCGYGFGEGRGELVYAGVDDEGRLITDLCARTTALDDADEDLAALGNGDAPRPGQGVHAEEDAFGGLGVWPAVGLAALLAVVLLLLVMGARRRGAAG